MKYTEYPTHNPEKRKTIMVLGRVDTIKFQSNINDSEVFLLSSRTRNIPTGLQKYLPEEGTVLIQNPGKTEEYSEISEVATEEYALKKHNILLRVLQELGATEVYVLSNNSEFAKSVKCVEANAEGKTPYGSGTIDANTETRNTEKNNETKVLSARYEGQAPNFIKARRILKEEGLSKDGEMLNIIKERESNNKQIDKRYKITGVQDIASTIKIAGRLSVSIPLYSAKISAKLDAYQKNKKSYTYEVYYKY